MTRLSLTPVLPKPWAVAARPAPWAPLLALDLAQGVQQMLLVTVTRRPEYGHSTGERPFGSFSPLAPSCGPRALRQPAVECAGQLPDDEASVHLPPRAASQRRRPALLLPRSALQGRPTAGQPSAARRGVRGTPLPGCHRWVCEGAHLTERCSRNPGSTNRNGARDLYARWRRRG